MISSEKLDWMGPAGKPELATEFGLRISGGGAHQSKTMMFSEIELLLNTGKRLPNEFEHAAVTENVLGKNTKNSQVLTYRHMASLYGLKSQPALTRVFFGLWQSDTPGRRLNCLLVSLARDPLLRDTASAVLETAIGSQLSRERVEAALHSAHPNRMSDKMVRSLAQNCNASWTQGGHLEGRATKVRRRVSATPSNVAFAALIAGFCGYGGPSILNSAWMRVLDLSPDQALDHLRRAEALGLARIRCAGDVTEITIRQPMAATLGVRELELV
jgi:hypothetical protein